MFWQDQMSPQSNSEITSKVLLQLDEYQAVRHLREEKCSTIEGLQAKLTITGVSMATDAWKLRLSNRKRPNSAVKR